MDAIASYFEDERRNKRQVKYSRNHTDAALSWKSSVFIAFIPYFYPQLFYQVLKFAMIVSSALMIWKGLMVVTGSESPIVVVLR